MLKYKFYRYKVNKYFLRHFKRLSRSLDKLYLEIEHEEFEKDNFFSRNKESQNNNFTSCSKDATFEKFKRQDSIDCENMKSFLIKDLNNNELQIGNATKAQSENASETNEIKLNYEKKINKRYENSITINIKQNSNNLKEKADNNINKKDIPNLSESVKDYKVFSSKLKINGYNSSDDLNVIERVEENEENNENSPINTSSKDKGNIGHKESRLKRIHTKNWSNEKQRSFIEINLKNETSINKGNNNEKQMNNKIENNSLVDKRINLGEKVEKESELGRRTSEKTHEKFVLQFIK